MKDILKKLGSVVMWTTLCISAVTLIQGFTQATILFLVHTDFWDTRVNVIGMVLEFYTTLYCTKQVYNDIIEIFHLIKEKSN